MFGPLSLREVERGVNDGAGLVLYEKRFLCGVDGVRLGPASIDAPFTGGVFALEPCASCGID